MTFPSAGQPATSDDTATTLPSDSEAHPAGSYPTHTADGKQVVGYDNGTSRPSSAPIDADTPVAPNAPVAPDHAERYLALPAGMRFETVAALSTIGLRRMEQDELHGGPEYDYKQGREFWCGVVDQQLKKLRDLDPTDYEGVIDRFLDIAAVAAAAMEGLQHGLDQLDNQVTRTLATNGGDSTGLANADTQLAGDEPPYQAEV